MHIVLISVYGNLVKDDELLQPTNETKENLRKKKNKITLNSIVGSNLGFCT